MTTTTGHDRTRTRGGRGAGSSSPSGAASRALARRARRQRQRAQQQVSQPGRPVVSALRRVPFVIAFMTILSVGVGGVLYLNTKIDESGMRTQKAKSTSSELRLEIEALHRTIADLNSTPRIAEQAKKLGLVPLKDAAMVVIGDDGSVSVVGDPTPVPAPSATESNDR